MPYNYINLKRKNKLGGREMIITARFNNFMLNNKTNIVSPAFNYIHR